MILQNQRIVILRQCNKFLIFFNIDNFKQNDEVISQFNTLKHYLGLYIFSAILTYSPF